MAKSEIEKFFSDDDDFFGSNTTLVASDENDGAIIDDGFEGQLSIDMYETKEDLVIKAPVAGVDPEDLEISITEDMVSIRGKRHEEHKEEKEGYHIHECYWGSFSRSQSLPVTVISEKADASINKKGVLTIRVPKAKQTKGKFLKIKTE